MPPPSRRPFADRFQLDRELGRGGMGVVHRAWELSARRWVALKVLLARGDPGRAARFEAEGRAMATLSHPGIVGVHAAGVDDGVAWLACELVEGARALDRAAKGEPLRRRVELVRDAARALGYAHARGVVHRDVKPDNLLVDGEGRVRVADFGLALADERERLTRTGQLVGTPLYMAPEQLVGRRDQLGPATDVWALGVTLHEVLTGAPPFEADSLASLVGLVTSAHRAPPSALAPEVPAALDAVVLAALAVEPADRPPDGEALARELDAWLEGRVPSCALARSRARATRRARAALALALLLALALGLAALGSASRARAARAEVEAALEWDGARCIAGQRACTGGAHALARHAFGQGDGPSPSLGELAAWRRRLEEASTSLSAERDGALVEAAREVDARLLAHERLRARRRCDAPASPAERLVEALLAVADRATSGAAVVSAVAAARGAQDPGGAAALVEACADQVAAGRDLPADAILMSAALAGPAERAALLRAAGPSTGAAICRAAEALLERGDLDALDALEALGRLVESGVVPLVAAGVADVRSSCAGPSLVLASLDDAHDEEGLTRAVASRRWRLWDALLARLAATDARGAGPLVARLVRALDVAVPGVRTAVLRGVRLAAWTAPLTETWLAMRFDAEAARHDPRPPSPGVTRHVIARLERLTFVGEDAAEALVYLERSGAPSRLSLPAWVAAQPDLRALVAARPWSRAAREALRRGEREPADPYARLDAVREVVGAPVNDLHPAAEHRLATVVVEAAADLLGREPVADPPRLDAVLSELSTRFAARSLGSCDVLGVRTQVWLSRAGAAAATEVPAMVDRWLLDLDPSLGAADGSRQALADLVHVWTGAWLATGRIGLTVGLDEDASVERRRLAASFLERGAPRALEQHPVASLLLARLCVRAGALERAESLLEGLVRVPAADLALVRTELAAARRQR